MIRSFRHKGLKRLYEDDDPRGVNGEHVKKVRDILARLDAAGAIGDMNLPGLRLHRLKGEFKYFWAVIVRANWRVIFGNGPVSKLVHYLIFRFMDGDAWDIDYLDYH